MEPVVPYLSFSGNAKEALSFYEKALGGRVEYMQTFGDSPMETPDEVKDKVMHAMFEAGELTIMASDIIDEGMPVTAGNNISLSLNFTSEADIDRVFAAMSEGSNITMPLEKTFWGAKFGMLTDPFGINWMFNHDYGEPNEKV